MALSLGSSEMDADTLKKLNLLIDALPKDEEGLVQYLKDAGIKGTPGVAKSCPLANFLADRGVTAAVNTHITVGNTQINTPSHWLQFVRNFDAGKYAELSTKPKSEPFYKYKPIYTYNSPYYDDNKW